MKQIRITRAAFETMKAECLRRSTETGGLLIGTVEVPTIIGTTVPGPRAEMSSGHFKADAEEDQRELDIAMRQYHGRVKNIGYWHRHLGNFSQPSCGDLAQARELVSELHGDAEESRVFVLIANVVNVIGGDQVMLYGYSLAKGETRFSPIQIVLVNNDSKEIRTALKREPAIIFPSDTDFWSDPEFQFYLTKKGKGRLEREVDGLARTGYSAQVKREKETRKLFLDITKDGLSLRCFLPEEYPLNPPHVLWLPSGRQINRLDAIGGWNSDCSIATVIKEVEERIIGFEASVTGQVTLRLRQREGKDESDYIKRAFPTFVAIARALGTAACTTLWRGQRKGRLGQYIPSWRRVLSRARDWRGAERSAPGT